MHRAALFPRSTLLLALLCLSLGLQASPGPSGSETLPSPDERHERSGRTVAHLLTRYHYRDHALDDTLSEYVFDAYFDALDPERYYFLRSDIQRFRTYRQRLDDLLEDGRVDLAYDIFGVYRQRVAERSEYAISLLQDGLNFAEGGRIQLDRSDSPWAESVSELETLWQRRVRHEALELKLSGEDWPKIKETLEGRYERLVRNTRQYNAEDVFQVFMNAWGHAFDPHTSYLSPRTSENFDINMRLSLEGIGALLRSERDYTEVVELIPGGPAAQDGQLDPGDRIIGVAQGDEEITNVVGWRLSDVVDLIRGPKDSVVRLQVLPAEAGASSQPEVIRLVRGKVKLAEKAAKSEVVEVNRGERALRVGVIDIPAFYIDFAAAQAGKSDYRSTTRDVRALIEELRGKDIDGLIIDLRSNAGGSLREAIEMTGLFIEQGPVVQVRGSDGSLQIHRDEDGGEVAYGGPLAVLVNGYSASASEIFAGAIQDYGRGVIVGSRTYGKGTVQRLVDLEQFNVSDGPAGRLKLTVAKFYRVTGGSTQHRGIEPDIELPSPVDVQELGESGADNALPWDHIDATDFSTNGNLAGVVPLLRDRYSERRAGNRAMQALMAEYAFLREQREQTELSLNEAQRRSEQEAAKQRRLKLVNQRLAALDRDPVDEVEALEEMELPDILLQSTAEIVADVHLLREVPDSDPARQLGKR
ncbi:carboxy terminal-processing peptidase [Ectothiorhodospiraceae bacterium WFHF3C12]|nr:carboxy terminal-processing peptidase [Ectothiorhodospiraceae bacterium WFHF3C12]